MTDEQKQKALAMFRAQCEVAHILHGRVSSGDAVQIARNVYREFGLDWDEELAPKEGA